METEGSETHIMTQPADTSNRTLREKYHHAKQLEGEVQSRIQTWANAWGKDTVTALIFNNFKAKATQSHGTNYDFSDLFGTIKTNSGVTAYVAHVVKYLPKLCTVVGEGVSAKISVSEPEVSARIEKVIAHTKGAIEPRHVVNTISCILEKDLYLPVLEDTAREIQELEAKQKHDTRKQTPSVQTIAQVEIDASPSISLLDLEENGEPEEGGWEETEDNGKREKALATLFTFYVCLKTQSSCASKQHLPTRTFASSCTFVYRGRAKNRDSSKLALHMARRKLKLSFVRQRWQPLQFEKPTANAIFSEICPVCFQLKFEITVVLKRERLTLHCTPLTGGFGSVNLTGDYVSTLIDHEESGDFDPTAVLRAQKYAAAIGNRTEVLEGHEGDLSNEDFIQTIKVTRMEQNDRKKFTDKEISEITRQITELLERSALDISHLSVKGLDRTADESAAFESKVPFILVRIKSEREARAILEKAVFSIDGSRYVSAPKSNRLVRFNISFKAAAANLQVSTERIVEFLNGTVFSEFVSRIVYTQSYSESTKSGSRFIRRFYAILRPPLGLAPEPSVLDPTNTAHQIYFIPTQYVFDPMGIVYISQCSAWECFRCQPLSKRYGHCSKVCQDSLPKGKGKGKGKGKLHRSPTDTAGAGSRGSNSARWEQARARAQKRKPEPTTQSPAHKQTAGTDRRDEIRTAALQGGADISGRF